MRSLPNSSPTMPCCGKFALISRRITASAARSASVTGSKSLVLLLSSMDSEVRKNGRMVSPEAVASRPMKAEKSITVTDCPLNPKAKRMLGYCLAQIEGFGQRSLELHPGILDAAAGRLVEPSADQISIMGLR